MTARFVRFRGGHGRGSQTPTEAAVVGQAPSAFARGPVLAIGLATAVVLLVFATRDGYHRDELYFVEASRHLAFGYVDQPPFTVLMARLSRALFGDSLFGLRLFPAVADGTTVVLAGLMARELGGRRFAQGLCAGSVGGTGYLVIAHLAGPTIYDLLAWSVVSLLVIRILRTGNDRLWLAVGVAVGFGLQAKETILLLVGGVALGLLATRRGRVFRSPWLWTGTAIAFAMWAPNIAWQVAHHWPSLEMDRNLRAEHSGLGFAVKYPFLQVLAVNLFLAPMWMAGLWALWRERRFESYRAFAVAYVVLFIALWVLIPDRFYYMAPLYVVLFAAGSIVTQEVAEGRRRFFREGFARRILWRSRKAAAAIVVVASLLFLPLALPVLPPAALAVVPLQKINYNLGETIGWPHFVATVAGVWRSLPAAERRSAVLVTANYGEAGAIDRYGSGFGLPGAYGGHNSFWWWGPPFPDRGVAVAVGFDRADLAPYFSVVRLATRFRNPWGVENDEEGAPIWICTNQRVGWSTIWPSFKHYG